MKKTLKVVGVLVAIFVVIFAGLAIYVSTLDADKYRPQLVDLLSKKTGRTVKLNGPIAFSLGITGIKVSIQDASISNPTWASRPNMAGMGKFEVGVGLVPLLTHSLSINELSIENADILLETNAAGKHNWDFGSDTPITTPPANKSAPVQEKTATGESLSISKLSIVNSQLAMRAANGTTSSYNVASLTLGMGGISGAELKFKGDANGAPITLDVKTGIKNLLSTASFPFDADLTYNAIHLTAKGTADIAGSKADVSAYEVSAGKTSIKGNVSATWDGPRPRIKGVLNSDEINMADFKSEDDDEGNLKPAAKEKSAPKSSGRMFSDAPLPLAGLKAADAELDISVAAFPIGRGALSQISAKLVLNNGSLSLAPVRANVGASPVELQLKLDASSSPAHFTVGVMGNSLDLGDIQKVADMAPFMTGKAGANIQLTGEGDSAHAIASSLGGILNITAEKGEILTGTAASVSSTLATVFNPQGGNAALNCLAARFTAKNGVLTDNGILIDSVPTTISGKGNINLALESVNLVLRPRTKLVDIGGLVPAVQVSGPISSPGYSVDAAGVVGSVVSQLESGNLDIAQSSVPDIQSAPAGQNACVYTLDHPKAATASTVLPADAVGKASQTINKLGGSLLKGVFGQ